MVKRLREIEKAHPERVHRPKRKSASPKDATRKQ
jgi:hypothetical protein